MKFLRYILILTAGIAGMAGMTGCIEDGFTSSPSDQPDFSTDTLRLGPLFTLEPSPTHSFTIRNPHDKGLTLSRVAFADDPDSLFRMNVDGMSGRDFRNVEIRPNDSIYVFVETTLSENLKAGPVDILAHIEVTANGVISSLPVTATARDAVRLSGDTRFAANTTLEADRPYLVRDSMVVEQGAVLTLPAGTELFMHSGAQILVYGTLRIEGTPDRPVNINGDRIGGFVAAEIPYELMSGQWGGIFFAPESRGNTICGASIRNSEWGLRLDNSELEMTNSVVRNSKGYIIEAYNSPLTLAGCELTDASQGILLLHGASHRVNHCTIANYYLFTVLGGPAVVMEHFEDDPAGGTDADELEAAAPYLEADFSNTIIYGNGTELSRGDFAGLPVMFRNCLLKSEGSDDDNFLQCLWGEDPLYYTDRMAYLFDYRLQPDSPAAAAGDPSLTLPQTSTDLLGIPRSTLSPSLGAYEFVPAEE